MNVPIVVSKDFMSPTDIKILVSDIEELEQTSRDSFVSDESGLRLALQFGKDDSHPESHASTGAVLGILPRSESLVKKSFDRVILSVKETFNVQEDLYSCAFWLGKQYPGAIIPLHDDTDSGFSSHNKYSGIVYLNSMEDGGDLFFPKFNFSYSPEEGSLVTFPSREAGIHGVSKINEVRYSLLFWMTFDKSRSLV
jgi:hypothetical protein